MAHKFYCEFCGKRFHSAMAATECSATPACRGLGFPPKAIESQWKVRGCAVILSRTAAELLQKSPAGKTRKEVHKMGESILKWAGRVEEAICANTPITLGKRTRVHNGLVDFVWQNVWIKKAPLPNLHALELAHLYANDAKAFVSDRIEDGLDQSFWFEETTPRASVDRSRSACHLLTKMKTRGVVDHT
jgi:hypothetical protein